MMSKKILVTVLAGALVAPVMADEKAELLKLRQDIAREREELVTLKHTTTSLIELFVQQGVLDKQKAEILLQASKTQANPEASETNRADNHDDKTAPSKKPTSIRFAYVPEFVKEEIRQEVISGLTNKVVTEVKADAKKEHWGIPAALPAWLNNFKLSGDVRLRAHDDFFGAVNAQQTYLDYPNINQAGGQLDAYRNNQQYLNTTHDRLRLRERFRLAIDTSVTERWKAGLRLATTNEFSPVSSNQTLGNMGKTYSVAIDRAFIQYDFLDGQHNDWFTLWGGRIANPWLSTEMLYSPDLSFEGFAGTFRWHMNQHNPVVQRYQPAQPNSRFGLQFGPQAPDALFVTLGAFPIQEVNFSTTDKWLFGGASGG